MRKVYLDHGATTPIHPEVVKAMVTNMQENWGNPSSIHSFGREAKKALEEARRRVAALIGSRPEEIIFTSGGTEADNIALQGVAKANRKRGNHIITSAVEHHAILDTCEALEKDGFEVTYLPVDEYGRVRVEDVEKAITDKTILISIMHGNNEVGTLQPISMIGKIAKERRIIFHTDAVQTVGKIPVNVDELGVNLLSISGHKIYGPKGVGAIFIRKGTRLHPLVYGGGQERRRRSGTENLPGVIGFGKACEIAMHELEKEKARLEGMRDRLITGLLTIEATQLNGHPTERLPHNVNISFEYVEGESILLSLDMKGIAASSGSACTSGSLDPSHVLLAMGVTHEVAHGSIRLTLGKDNTDEDVDYTLAVFPEIISRFRAMSPLYNPTK